MNKRLFYISCLVAILTISTTKSIAQSTDTVSSFMEQMMQNFIEYYKVTNHEKLYLQTDKPYYSAGDKIWLKGHLVNAFTNSPIQSRTNYIYIELIDRRDSLISRVKIKRDSCGFNNSIAIPTDIAQGEYLLRGYTQLMRNVDPGLFFSRKLVIANPIDERKKINKPLKRKQIKSAAAVDTTDFDVQFFPEGGALLANILQTVAFKAVGSDGLSVAVTGALYLGDSLILDNIKSENLGMGAFGFAIKEDAKYFAEFVTAAGKTKRFELPTVEKSGAILKVANRANALMFQIEASKDIDLSALSLVLISRGCLVSVTDVNTENLVVSVDRSQLPSGVGYVCLVERSTQSIISRRMFFTPETVTPKINISANGEEFLPRKRVDLNIYVQDSNGVPAKGNFGVSITDRNVVVPDSLTANISTYMLLNSELKGNVEAPQSYFPQTDRMKMRALDVLMMTQGWSRFNVDSILRGKIIKPEFSFEQNQSISGEIKGFFGNAARQPSVVIFEPKSGYFDMFTLESGNKFRFIDLDIPDSTKYVIQAMGRNGGARTVQVNIIDNGLPDLVGVFPDHDGSDTVLLPDGFLSQSKERYYYQGGMRVVDMDAVVVTSKKSETRKLLYNATPDHSIAANDLENCSSIFLALMRLPGVVVTGSKVSVRGNQNPPLVYVDQTQIDVESLDMIIPSHVEAIDLITGPSASMFGLGAGAGVILITSKEGMSMSQNIEPLPSLVNVAQLGYKRADRFYQPRYEVENIRTQTIPDLRTTIAWEPRVVTDSTGYAKISFFTADKAAIYDVTIEGVSDDGEVCNYGTTIRNVGVR